MTKLTLIIFLLVSNTIAKSQTQINAKEVTHAEWDAISKSWVNPKNTPCSITITFTKSVVYASDNAKSKYTVIRDYPKITKECKSIQGWDAIDELRRECKLYLSNYCDGNSYFIIVYPNFMIEYKL
jgi:hypothetical protein